MFVVKFDYDAIEEPNTKTKMLVYGAFADADKLFEQLNRCFQFGDPLKVKSGKVIDVVGAWLYEADANDSAGAITIVKAGTARLIKEAQTIEIDIDL